MKVSPDVLPHIPFNALDVGEVFKLVRPEDYNFTASDIFMVVADEQTNSNLNAVELQSGNLYKFTRFTSVFPVSVQLVANPPATED